MTFEERKRRASSLLVDFLDVFSTPRGLDEAQLTKRISATADAFARRMPTTGDFDEHCEKVFNRVRDTHMSNSWPTQAEFVLAMPANEALRGKAAQTFAPDQIEIMAGRMERSDGVPESFIWNRNLAGRVDRGRLESYRKASAEKWREIHRDEAPAKMAEKYGDEVLMYFKPERTA